MTEESLLHCSALLMIDFKDPAHRADHSLQQYVISLARSLKRDCERRPARGYRDEEPATGIFCAFDAGLGLAREIAARGIALPASHRFEDARRDLCFQFKYAPGRRPSSDPRATRYTIEPCPLGEYGEMRPLDFFRRLRLQVLSWRAPCGAELFDPHSEVFLVGARPLPMIEMFAGLQPHDFTDAFPDSGLSPVQPQTGNLLFIQLQQENLSRWRAAGGHTRRRAMGGMFTSRVLAPGQSYALELQSVAEEFDPCINQVFVDAQTIESPEGLGYICRIHDGFSRFPGDPEYKVAMRESFLPEIEEPEIVREFCELRESEMAAIKFPEGLDSIRLSRGGKRICELALDRSRARERRGLIGAIDFDPAIPKLTVRLPFLFFPDIELPRRLLERSVVVEWVNEHRQEGRHTISFWPQEHGPSHRAQCLRALSGRLKVTAHYLGGRAAAAGMDNIVVYRDDFHIEAAQRLMPGADAAIKRGSLSEQFNSVFTGRATDTADSLEAFIQMMISMLASKGAGNKDAKRAKALQEGRALEGIAPFVASRYSLVFREPVIIS